MKTLNYLKAGLITLAMLGAYSSNAQQTADQQATAQKEDKVFKYVGQMPEFGQGDLMAWLGTNIKYPEQARKTSVEGRVLVGFVVMASGQVANPLIRKSSGNDMLDAEALRVVAAMPAWKPGRDKGEPVNVEFTLPITFKLEPAKKS